MRSVVVALALVGLTLSLRPALAAPVLVPTAQSRALDVSAAVFDKSDAGSASAPDFGPFDRSISVHPIMMVGTERYAAQGSASQNSTLGSDAFTFAGSLYAQSIHPADSSASARVLFDVAFDVQDIVRYALAGSLTNPNSSPADASLTLQLLNGNQTIVSTGPSDTAINKTGLLQPGSYRLVFDASGRGDSTFAGGAIDYGLTFSAAVDGGVQTPLPPAAWSGLVLLAILVGWRLLPKPRHA